MGSEIAQTLVKGPFEFLELLAKILPRGAPAGWQWKGVPQRLSKRNMAKGYGVSNTFSATAG